MTADTLTKISNFLRDTEVRVGHLTYLIYSLRDEGSLDYQDAYQQRKALMDFYFILNDRYSGVFENDTTIKTFLTASPLASMDTTKYPEWTEREIVDEIDWLRYYGQLSYTSGTSVGYYVSSFNVTANLAPLISLQGYWDPNLNLPVLSDASLLAQGYYYLVINADNGVLFQSSSLFNNVPITFFTDDVVLSTGALWIVLRGDRFTSIVDRSIDTTPSGTVALDLRNFKNVNLYGSATITEAKTWSLTNTTNNRKFSFKFTLSAAWVQTMPSTFKMSDVQWDPVAKTWSPIQGGEYQAEGLLVNNEWLVKITGPYV